LLICIAHALLLAMTPPYKQASTAFTAIATSVLLQFTLLVALLVMMYDTLPTALTKGFFGFDSVLPLALIIFAFNVLVVAVACGLFLYQLGIESRLQSIHRLRLLDTKAAATLRTLPSLAQLMLELHPNSEHLQPDPHGKDPRPHAGPFHVFLSHNWKHGQSEMRIIKTRLREMLPNASVFLDVDNHGAGKDFPHIDVSDAVLCYLSELWFTNAPCLREVVRAMIRKKPLIALLEPDTSEQHGGHHEAKCRDILLSRAYADKMEAIMGLQVKHWAKAWGQPDLRLPTGEEIVAALFETQPAVVWYRLADFQDVSMRLIAERLLPNAPQAASPYRQTAYMRGEIVQQVKGKLKLPAVRVDCEFHLYLSPSSPGGGTAGLNIAEELKALLPTLTWTDDPAKLASCEHMPVLLTSETWTRGEASDAYARDVCRAMRQGVHRLLVHEVVGARHGDNEARHAISFEQIIGETPRHLFEAKLYNEIAQNLGGGEWREAGLAKMAAQLCKGSGTREQWYRSVGPLQPVRVGKARGERRVAWSVDRVAPFGAHN